jgi:hypothetical protein
LDLALALVVVLRARLGEAVCPSRGAPVSAGKRFCRKCGSLQTGVQLGLASADAYPEGEIRTPNLRPMFGVTRFRA